MKQRHCGYDFKINQALDADPSDAAQIAVAGDARDQRAENQRRDNHFDQAQENVAEDAQVFREVRAVQADFSAEQHGEENPVSERRFAPTGGGDQGEAKPTQRRQPEMRRKENRQHGAREKKKNAEDCE